MYFLQAASIWPFFLNQSSINDLSDFTWQFKLLTQMILMVFSHSFTKYVYLYNPFHWHVSAWWMHRKKKLPVCSVVMTQTASQSLLTEVVSLDVISFFYRPTCCMIWSFLCNIFISCYLFILFFFFFIDCHVRCNNYHQSSIDSLRSIGSE